MRAGIAATSIGICLWANTAWSEPNQISDQIPIQVNARLAPGCPTASDFALSLIRRTRRLRLGRPDESGIVFDISAANVPNGFVGQLHIRELDGRLTQRVVEGTNCSEIINAFAFVAAVLVDPEAAAKIEEPKPEEAPAATKVAPAATKVAPAAVEFNPANAHSRPKALELGVGVAFGANSVAAPTVEPSFGPRLTGTTQRLVFPFWAALGWDYRVASSKTVSLGTTTGEASIGSWTGYLLASPLDWQPVSHLHVRPMVQLELGQVSARKVKVIPDTKQSQSRTWFAVGVGGNAELQIARPLIAFLEVGLLYPLYQTSFYFVGSEQALPVSVYAADSLGWNLRIGLALRFW